MTAVCLAHLEEEEDRDEGEVESDDPDGLRGVTEEFMVHLALVVKDAQMEVKHCYHCSSLEHFIHNCPLVKTMRAGVQLNCAEGTLLRKGGQTPLARQSVPKDPQEEASKA